MQIGKYNISSIETGSFALDGGAMFGIIPKPLWNKTNPSDDINRITLNTRCLLLQSESKNILIDTGIGSSWDDKFNNMYSVDHSQTLFNSLKKKKLNPDDITDVILTHLHFDHTGGSVILENDKFIPAFPNASYHARKKHFEWALNPSDRDRGSFVKSRFMPLYENGLLKLTESTQFDDEIEFIVVNGHTFSQQLVKISDSSNTLFYCGDLIPTASHIPIPYIMGYDLQAFETLREKQYLLPHAVEQNWILVFEHDPFCAASTVKKTEKGFTADHKMLEIL